MTSQTNDMVEFEGEKYFFETTTSENLFDVKDYWLTPQLGATGPWNGRVLKYQVADNKLLLKELYVNIGRNNKAPVIDGIEATLEEEIMLDEKTPFPTLFSHEYRDMSLPIRFTGGMLLKTDFIGGFSTQMGFHPTWASRKAIELIFEEGTLIKRRDVSKLMAEYRKRFITVGTTPDKRETEKWGKDNFTLDYTFYSISNTELVEEEENQMKWNKFIIIGIITGIIGLLLMEINPIQENSRLSAIPVFILLGGIGLLNSGILGRFTRKKRIALKGREKESYTS